MGVMEPNLGATGTDLGEQVFPFLGMSRFGRARRARLSRSVGLGLVQGDQYVLMDGWDGVREGSGMDSVWNLTFYPSAGRGSGRPDRAITS